MDYHLATSGMAAQARRQPTQHIYPAQRFSDHAPLVIDCDFKL